MTRAELAQLFERYGPMVYRRALVLLGNHHDAEEAAQEVFFRAMVHLEAFEERSRVSTWLYQITSNHCLNLLRDTKRHRDLLREQHAVTDHAPGAPDPARMLLLRQLLAEAEETSARAAIYVYVDGMSHQEAAGLLGVSRRTVGNLLERFNAQARDSLALAPRPREAEQT